MDLVEFEVRGSGSVEVRVNLEVSEVRGGSGSVRSKGWIW